MFAWDLEIDCMLYAEMRGIRSDRRGEVEGGMRTYSLGAFDDREMDYNFYDIFWGPFQLVSLS